MPISKPIPHPISATPMAFAQAIVLAYRRYDRDPADALKLAQIAPDQLANPAARITAWQFQQLSGTAMRELDDEALGWFSRRLPWGSYGMLVRASISAPTLGIALRRWCRHHGLLTDDIALQLRVADGQAQLTLTEHRDLGTLQEFCLVSVLRNFLGVASWLVDSRIPLQSVQFPFAPPPHHAAYAVLFSDATRFGAPATSLTFDARYLAMPLRRDERALQVMLQNALPLTVLQYRRDRLLVQRVRQALAAHAENTHNADALAALLHLSPRTLHRQLKEEGATLQGLKDEVRQHSATELLLRTTRPIKQVAQAAGFQNEKSFIRAFKGWTGHTPAEFRRQAMAD
jgi:AraC-like DNA-binding protein